MMTTTTETKKKTVAEIRAELAAAESRLAATSRALADRDGMASEAFDEADRACRRLQAALQEATRLEESKAAAEREVAREATRASLEAEAKAYSIEHRDAFAAEVVAEAVAIEARLVALYAKIESRTEEARAARERFLRVAAQANVPAPIVPIWAGFVGEVGTAILRAHERRMPDARGDAAHIRHLRQSRVTIQAERAREMIAPKRFGA